MANWKNALAAKNYTPENLGAAGKNGIKEYNELEVDLEELKGFEGEEGYDPKAVALIEKELLRLDIKITKAIDIREAQLANIQKMQSARGKVKEAKVVVETKKAEEPIVVEQTKKLQDQSNVTTTLPKKSNGWAWFTGIAATVVLSLVGVNYVKNNL